VDSVFCERGETWNSLKVLIWKDYENRFPG
jgi:hypothetical protein